MVKIGDTFRLANYGIKSHLFIIISDPNKDPNRIVTANFTSWQPDKDQSCVVEVGQHPFIRRRSCVYYGEDRLITLTKYKRSLLSGAISSYAPVGEHLLARILVGAAASPLFPLGSRQILVEQGLIDGE